MKLSGQLKVELISAQNTSDSNKNAFAGMAVDLLENLLKSADNPGDVGSYLSSELLELTGARCVIILQYDDYSGHQLFTFKPDRRKDIASSDSVKLLSELLMQYEKPVLWNYSESISDAEEILKSLSIELSIGVPLKLKEKFLGSILILNLPSREGIEQVVKTLEMLSTVTALIFKNALLYLKQEEIIESRTKTIKEDERRLSSLIEHLPGIVYKSKADYFWTKEFLSPKCEELTGYKENVFTDGSGFSFREIINPDDIEYVLSTVQKAAELKIDYELNYRIKTFDEKEKWFWDKGSAIYSDDGSVTGYEGFIADVTEKYESDEALRKSEERFKNVAENADEWIWEVDNNGMYTYSSPAVERILGYKPTELVGKKYCYDLFDPAIINKLKEEVFESFNQAASFRNFINPNRHKNGTLVILETNGVPIFDKNGDLIGYQGTDEDITQRKLSEKALMENETKLRTIFNCSLDAIGVSKLGIHVLVNPAYVDLYGYQYADELIGKPVIDIIAESEKENILERIKKRARREAVPNSYETIGLKKNGEEFIMEVNVSQYELYDEYYTLVIIRDITERRKNENIIQLSLKEKETLLRELYHRTKNNMQVIYAFLMIQASSISNNEMINLLEEMANRILTMSLVHEKLYQSQNLSQVNLKEYIVDLTTLILKSYEKTRDRIRLVFDLEDVNVLIDTAIPCGLIINELISNSFKYAFPGDMNGEIKIQLKKSQVGLIQLNIKDNGIGFSENIKLGELESLGIRIIYSITENQLNGKISYKVKDGVSWQIEFNDSLYEVRV